MRAKLLALSVVVLVAVVATVLFVDRQPSPAVTVRYVKSVQEGDCIWATFEFSNHTANTYFVDGGSVEVRQGAYWQEIWNSPAPLSDLGGHGSAYCTLPVTNLPTASQARIRVWAAKELKGPAGIFLRLKFNLRGQKVTLNPFNKSSRVFSEPTQIVSEEFVEPARK